MTAFTVFGQPANPATLTSDDEALTIGMQFTLSQPCPLTAIWWWSPSGAADLPAATAIYAVSGGTVVTGTQNSSPSWSGIAGSGWVKVTYDGSVTLAASTSYKVAIYHGFSAGHNYYGSTANYWSSGAGSGGLTSGPITAVNNAGGDGGQDTFDTAGTQGYPNASFNATNYWVD